MQSDVLLHQRAPIAVDRRPLALSAHLRQVTRALVPVARLAADQALVFSISLPLRDPAGLDALLRDLQDPWSPRFRQYLSSDDFARAFGPTEADYQRVVDFAQAHGLSVLLKHPNRALLSLTAPAQRVERAFAVSLQVYRHPLEDRTFFAPDDDPRIESGLPILEVHGLHDYFTKRHVVTAPLSGDAASKPAAGSGPGGLLLSADLRKAYAPGVAMRGEGQAVGIYNPQHGLNVNDVLSYQQKAGISPPVPVNKVLLDGPDVPSDNFSLEVTLDVEMAIAMAPGLSQVLVYQSNDGMTALNRMATDNIAKQLSTSWPTPPQGQGADQVYKQMAAQGQTFFSAAGDAGSYYHLGQNRQPFYADDPNITVVAGTQVTLSAAGDWQSEVVWHDSFGSGGGGNMGNYPLPDWQRGIDMTKNGGSTQNRNSPDVALPATNIYMFKGGDVGVVGTSAAAPLWAGYLALVNESAAKGGKASVGALNPSLYALGKSSGRDAYFHDIVQGNNFTPWNDNPGGASEYSAVPGYDCCTGWGTPTGKAIIETLGRDGPALEPVRSRALAAIRDASGRIDVFSLTVDASLAHVHQVVPNGNWSPWLALSGHSLQQLRVQRNQDGRLEAFVLGGDHSVYHRWEVAPDGGWGSWASLQGVDLRSIEVASNQDGRLELFVLGGDRSTYHRWQLTPNGGWSGWSSLQGHDLQNLVVGANQDGRLEIFALGADPALYHRWQTTPNGGWGAWATLEGVDLQDIVIGKNQDGRLEVFALGGDKSIWHRWQTTPNGDWGPWRSLAGHDIRKIVVANNEDGRLELFALGGDRAIYHRWQTAPNGGWGAWSTLAGHDLQDLVVVNNADGRLEVFALGGDGYVYHRWQVTKNGGWSDWAILR